MPEFGRRKEPECMARRRSRLKSNGGRSRVGEKGEGKLKSRDKDNIGEC